ncbi:MAG: TolC family protein [Flavobacteriales bacterium]
MIRILIILIFSSPLLAQQSLSVEQAIELGLEKNNSIKNAVLDLEYAKKQIKETVAIGLPKINGELNWQQFIEIPTTLVPANMFDPNASEDDFSELQFGTKHNATSTLSASQLIFDGTYIVGLRASSTFKKLSEKSLELTKQQVEDSIAAMYYNVLVAEHRNKFLKTIADIHTDILQEITIRYEQGMVEDLDVDRMSLTLSNMKTQSENMNRITQMSYLMLKLIIGIPIEQELVLSDSLSGLLSASEQIVIEEPVIENRIEYQLAQTNVRINELDVRRYQSNYLPSIVAFGSYSKNAMRNEFNFDENGKWYPTQVVGLKATMNIFDGFSLRSKIQKAKIKLEQSKNDLYLMKQSLSLDHLNAQSSFLTSLNNQKIKENNLELAEKIYYKSMIKYKEGLISSIELSQAGAEYLEAYSENSQAIYSLLKAKTNYQRTLGK